MLNFKTFVEQEEDEDILRTLAKIPKSHAGLVKGYTFKFQGGNTLSDDDDHIGYVRDEPKEIVVAAPWRYGREFVILHEIGHKVWEKMPGDIKNQWAAILARTPNRQKQNVEEMFSQAYGATYCKNPPAIHSHPEWFAFIKSLPC
jgi:hypothetical protein